MRHFIPVRNPDYHSYYFTNRPITLKGERDATWQVVLYTGKDSTVTTYEGQNCTFTMDSRHTGATIYVHPSEFTDGLSTPLQPTSSCSKFLHNGQILICRNGKLYNLWGHSL